MKTPVPSQVPAKERASVLLISLSFILLMTVISVAFLVRSRVSLQTSDSYSKEMVAQELGELGADKIVADFQKEIAAAIAGGSNLFLPPQGGMTNTGVRTNCYIRRTQNLSYPTTTASKNGWMISTNRWKMPGMLPAAATLQAPDWVFVDKQVSGTVTAADVLGRYAVAVYDASGMLDVNEAGTTLPIGDKGSTVFADLGALPGGAGLSALVAWRGGTNTLTSYYGDTNYSAANYANAVDPTKAGRLESPVTATYAPGENLFFSRMELVQAANKNQLGLTVADLPHLRTTRSQAANRVTAEDVYASGTATLMSLTNAALVATADTVIPVTRISGTTENITIKSGKSLLELRFPLARLRWMASRQPDGTPNFPAQIKRYFGLTWSGGQFIYTGSDSLLADMTPATSVRTLANLCAAINAGTIAPREPNFFEWLKGAINPDSLGKTGGSTDRIFVDTANGTSFFNGTLGTSTNAPYAGTGTIWETSKDLQIIGIGANIIDQSDPDSIPTAIASVFPGTDLRVFRPLAAVNPFPPVKAYVSYGVENIPYLNEVVSSVMRSDAAGVPAAGGAYLTGYLQFEMWNPHRNPTTQANPPLDYQGNPMANFRVRTTQGRVVMEPFVYVNATGGSAGAGDPNYRIKSAGQPFPGTQYTGNPREKYNSAWAALQRIAEYSQKDLLAANYNSPDLTGNVVNFAMNAAGGFFAEPYLANVNMANSQDSSNPDPQNGNVSAFLGAPPDPGLNAMPVCIVQTPVASPVTGITLDSIYFDHGGNTPITPYPLNDFPGRPNPDTPEYFVPDPLAQKSMNAAAFISDGQTVRGIDTHPVTFAVEVRASDGTWHTCKTYNNLGMDVRGSGQWGPQRSIVSADWNTKQQGFGNALDSDSWRNASNTTWPPPPAGIKSVGACFHSWLEWRVRKAYNMTDPRSERFGLGSQIGSTPGASIRTHTGNWAGSGQSYSLSNVLSTSVGTSFLNVTGSSSNEGPAARWAVTDAGAANVSVPADLAMNYGVITGNPIMPGPNPSHFYADYDDVVRPADARWNDINEHPALPVATYPGAVNSRPGILNRPFRSVAELGVVFRDIPWKSMDLFSPESPDRRLLDVFSITDSNMVSGKINPNLARVETLRAILRGTSLEPANTATTAVTSADADAVATLIAALTPTTTADRVTSLNNLAARLSDGDPDGPGPISAYTGSPAAPATGDPVRSYKPRVENYLRAMSSTFDTRSWQLMFDVIAQSGKIAPGSTSLADFVVAGQRRFFVYLTLDRITGEVLGKQIEPVYE